MHVKNNIKLLLCSVCVLCLNSAGDVFAQSVMGVPHVPVKQNRNTYDVDGAKIRYSDTTLYLKGSAGMEYTDNVYRAKNSADSDFVFIVSPDASLRTNWDKHSLRFDVGADVGFYASESENNYNDVDAKVTGRYDVSTGSYVEGYAGYRYDHGAIGADEDQPESMLSDVAVYDVFNLGALWSSSINDDVNYIVGWKGDYYDYDNATRRNGTAVIYDDKDRTENMFFVEMGHDIQPDINVYTILNYDIFDYDKRIDTTATYSHDADGFGGVIGVKGKRDVYYWDVASGYRSRNYNAAVLEDADMLATSILVGMDVSKLSNIEFEFNRDIRESSTYGISSYIQSRADLAWDYKINTDWSTKLNGRYTYNDFQSNVALTGDTLADKIYEPSVTVTYGATDGVDLDVEYRYRKRTSTDSSRDYDENVIGASLNFKY